LYNGKNIQVAHIKHVNINCVVWYFQQAEKYFIQADSIKDAIDMYNMASKWEEAYRVSANICYFTLT